MSEQEAEDSVDDTSESIDATAESTATSRDNATAESTATSRDNSDETEEKNSETTPKMVSYTNSLIVAKVLNPLDELTDAQLVEFVTDMETKCQRLRLENVCFTNFLQKNDPEGLDCAEPIMIKSRRTTSAESDDILIKRGSYSRVGSRTSESDGKSPRINLTQKGELVLKAMEETQTDLEEFQKSSNRTRFNLRANIEELGMRESEIRETINIFQNVIIIEGVDKLTQRIPAEKFVRFMQEWLKSAQLSIEKLRLRITTTKNQYKKLNHHMQVREELGENIRVVDFEKLRIENKHFLKTIEQKNVDLLEMKHMTGNANLVLTNQKKNLQKKLDELENLRKAIIIKEKKNAELCIECEKAEEDVKKAKKQYDYLVHLKASYSVPDVMEYINIKSELNELEKVIKIRKRRKNVQDISLNACITEMKNITGSSVVKSTWFKIEETNYEDEMSFKMDFFKQ